MSKNFTNTKELCYWVQKVLPLVYDDSLSYYELLSKIVAKLNILIENNSKIPDYILELVRNYIDNKDIDALIEGTIRDYILNVKYPPNGLPQAIGDGTTNDTAAIQSCINYAHENGYGVVYFPYGNYLVDGLTLYNNVSLKGFDRYSTTLTQTLGATKSLITAECNSVGIYDLALDAKGGTQLTTLSTIYLKGNDYELNNLLFKDSYTAIQTLTNGHCQVDNIVIKSAIDKALLLNSENIQITNTIIEKISNSKGQVGIVIDGNNGRFDIDSYADVPLLFEINGNNNNIITKATNYTKLYENKGENNIITDLAKIMLDGNVNVKGDVNINDKLTVDSEHTVINNMLSFGSVDTTARFFDTVNIKTLDNVKRGLLLYDENKFSKLYKTVDDFGADPTGTVDNSELFQRLLNEKHALVLGNGVYKLTKKLTCDGQCCITGLSPKSSILWWDSDSLNAGISVSMNTTNGYYSTLCTIRDCSVLSDMAPTETAIYINGTRTIGDRYTLRPVIKNVQISTYKASPFDKGWLRCIDLNDLNGSSINDCCLIGAIKDKEPNYYSTGIFIHGEKTSQSNSEFMISNVKISLCETAILGNFLEGIMLVNSVIIGVNYGISWIEDRQTDHLMVTGCHINARVRCIVTEYVAQFNITGNLLYIDNSNPMYAIEMREHSYIGCITGNVIQTIGTMQNGGAITISGNAISITGNSINIGNNTGIWLRNTSSNNIVVGNTFITSSEKVVNSGNNNKVPYQAIAISEIGNVCSVRGNSVIYADSEFLHIKMCIIANQQALETQRIALLNLNGLSVVEQTNIVCPTSDDICTINVSSNGDIRINNKGINEGAWTYIDLDVPLR